MLLILTKIDKKVFTRKLLIVALALGVGLIVVESQPLRKWTTEAIGLAAPSISVLEFLIPRLSNQTIED